MRCRWSLVRCLAGLSLPLLLGACSPHPGAGKWISSEGEPSTFYRLEVHYDGRAELYLPGQDVEALRCFWGGAGPDSILLDCTAAEAVEERVRYVLRVAGDGGAELLQEEKRIAGFSRAPE
jgi:hypothetical protein